MYQGSQTAPFTGKLKMRFSDLVSQPQSVNAMEPDNPNFDLLFGAGGNSIEDYEPAQGGVFGAENR
jgi:hypothetical protein